MKEKEERELGKKYLVVVLTDEGSLETQERKEKPPLGGYLSEKKYGNPNYCPTATRWHKKAAEKTGAMPNLVWFDSAEAAVASGFSPCGSCWVRGEMAEERWLDYLAACTDLGVEPVEPPKVINKLQG